MTKLIHAFIVAGFAAVSFAAVAQTPAPAPTPAPAAATAPKADTSGAMKAEEKKPTMKERRAARAAKANEENKKRASVSDPTGTNAGSRGSGGN